MCPKSFFGISPLSTLELSVIMIIGFRPLHSAPTGHFPTPATCFGGNRIPSSTSIEPFYNASERSPISGGIMKPPLHFNGGGGGASGIRQESEKYKRRRQPEIEIAKPCMRTTPEPTSDKNLDRPRGFAAPERRVGDARVLSLVGRYHRLDNERPLIRRSHVPRLSVVDANVIPVPQDYGQRRVRLHRAFDPSRHAPREVDASRHVENTGIIWREREKKKHVKICLLKTSYLVFVTFIFADDFLSISSGVGK